MILKNSKCSFIAFVPIRKGSKGVPNKNLRLLAGKPLVFWILDTLLSSNRFDAIWVATDSSEAEAIINKVYGSAIHIFRRSPESATDDAPVTAVLLEFMTSKPELGHSIFFLSQATVPFTSIADIITAVDKIAVDHIHESWVSCRRIKKFSWSENGVPLNYSLNTKPRRQDYRGMLIETGAFYASKYSTIMETGMLLSGKIGIIESMGGTEIDIDTEEDWKLAEIYAQHGLYS